jgi:hypothetical protein
MRVVGLTGGIACGKSTVSAQLKQQGIHLIDCDAIAHAVTAQGAWGYWRVVAAFGRNILLANGRRPKCVAWAEQQVQQPAAGMCSSSWESLLDTQLAAGSWQLMVSTSSSAS